MLPWLDQRKPDVVCLQETKLADGAFEATLAACSERRSKELGLGFFVVPNSLARTHGLIDLP